eukprot:CAMPEP_0114118284 /NCGR_PEP_ID=MMETSP0043_2-20121206/5499_1 /TAXON_ID=464988 /ORGANISM="Hemiselmis andersenii, Strain CCMP644" /LENGTH=144 /DNA_ID=CAMNT_0001210761 /DNA_START=85 /DNA_END=516 /DNA_ORIENTATION=-
MSMIPDKTPRKAMGGGFRSHSPPRSSTNKANQAKRAAQSPMPSITGTGNQLRPHLPGSRPSSARKSAHGSATRAGGHGIDKLLLEQEYVSNLEAQVNILQLGLAQTREDPHHDASQPLSARGEASKAVSFDRGSIENAGSSHSR